MKEIKLTRGGIAIVDDEDFDRVTAMGKWQLHSNGCAAKVVRSKGDHKKRFALRMHRLILNAPKDLVVDHINGDQLDNRKSNLRICTQSNNTKNKVKSANNTSGFKGVTFRAKTGKYIAQIMINYKGVYLGVFENPIEAAEAYNKAAIKYYGTFAKLNQL